MGFLDMLKGSGIGMDAGVARWKEMPGAVLLDVRGADEYAYGHVPGALNVPLQQLDQVAKAVPDKQTPLFVHCLSGARSARATAALKQMGYANVENIGGMNTYNGPEEEGR